MKLFNLSQHTIAQQIGISQSSICRLLKCKKQRDITYGKVGYWLQNKRDRLRERMAQPNTNEIKKPCGQVDIILDNKLTPDVIKNLLQSYMNLFNLSQHKVAQQIGISQPSICNLLKGKKQMDITYGKVGSWLQNQRDRLRERMVQPNTDDILELIERATIEKFLEV
jgi:predicted XRE-type DNA-binding protein